jgi:hypothetical protein
LHRGEIASRIPERCGRTARRATRPKGLDRIGKTIPAIIVSPTVVRRFPLLVLRIVGSLSDRETVRLALKLGD